MQRLLGCESPGGGQPRPPDQLWGCGTYQKRLETSKPSSLESKNKRLVCTKLLQLWGQNQTQEKGGGKRKCGSKNSILFVSSEGGGVTFMVLRIEFGACKHVC